MALLTKQTNKKKKQECKGIHHGGPRGSGCIWKRLSTKCFSCLSRGSQLSF